MLNDHREEWTDASTPNEKIRLYKIRLIEESLKIQPEMLNSRVIRGGVSLFAAKMMNSDVFKSLLFPSEHAVFVKLHL